jgi:hypothetical protein
MILRINLILEKVFLQIESESNGSHHPNMQFVGRLSEKYLAADSRRVAGELTWKNPSINALNPGTSDSSGHMFRQILPQSRPISIDSL